MRKNEKITALYERLSRDDFGKDDDQQRESNSISNQKAMLEEFAARQGFTNIVHFTDDGISGTCFDRPGFLAMMKEVEAGNVEYSLDCDNGIEDAVVHRSPTPEEVLEDKQLRDQIFTAVMELPDKQAKRIYARFYLDMSVKEIAQVEGVDPRRVRDSIHLGLKKLEKVFSQASEYMSITVSAITASKRVFVLVRLSLKKSCWTPWPI